jgi:hypothetical protein
MKFLPQKLVIDPISTHKLPAAGSAFIQLGTLYLAIFLGNFRAKVKALFFCSLVSIGFKRKPAGHCRGFQPKKCPLTLKSCESAKAHPS